MHFTTTKLSIASSQHKRVGKGCISKKKTLTSPLKRIKTSIGSSLAKSVDRWTSIAEEQIKLIHEPKSTPAKK